MSESKGIIRDMKLMNFKSFRQLEMRLGQITVLAGTNSAGKSTVMQALALLQQSRDHEPPGLVLNGDLVELGDFQDLMYDRVERGADGTAEDEFVQIRLRATSGGWQGFGGSAESAADFVHVADRSSASMTLPWTRLSYVKADRLGPVLVHEKSHLAVVQERTVGTHGEFAVHLLLEHRDRQVPKILRLDGAGASLEDQAGAWIDRLASGTRIYPDHLEGVGAAVLRFSNGAVTGLSGGRLHRSTNVGFGLSYSLPIIVACLIAGRGDLLLIENPEAHLHPRAQRELARLCVLASLAGAQVVLETHSDHVLNAVRIAVGSSEIRRDRVEIYFFHPTGDGQPATIRLELGEDGSIARWPEGFFDDYFDALLRLSALSDK